MKPQVSLWAVYVRRESVATVLVKTSDPEEARRVALEHADQWTDSVHAVAYPHQGRPDHPVWCEGQWIHPQTDLPKGEQ